MWFFLCLTLAALFLFEIVVRMIDPAAIFRIVEKRRVGEVVENSFMLCCA